MVLSWTEILIRQCSYALTLCDTRMAFLLAAPVCDSLCDGVSACVCECVAEVAQERVHVRAQQDK